MYSKTPKYPCDNLSEHPVVNETLAAAANEIQKRPTSLYTHRAKPCTRFAGRTHVDTVQVLYATRFSWELNIPFQDYDSPRSGDNLRKCGGTVSVLIL